MPKRALILGIANERSLGYAIAKQLKSQGARLGCTFLNDALERRVRPLAEILEAEIITGCDVSNPGSLKDLRSSVEKQWGGLDILVHSVAYAEKEDLEGRFLDTSKAGFLKALEISAYSLVACIQVLESLFSEGAHIVTLTYHGSTQVVPNYNVMGVAKAALEASVRYLAYELGARKITINAISAGPVKTLAASGVRDFRAMLKESAEKTPLKENITAEDVGAMGGFLCSEAAKHITGSIFYVDSGAHIIS